MSARARRARPTAGRPGAPSRAPRSTRRSPGHAARSPRPTTASRARATGRSRRGAPGDLPFDRRYQLVLVLITKGTDEALDEAEKVCRDARALVESGVVAQPWRLLLAKVEYARDQSDAGDRLVEECFARDSHDREWLLRELEVMARELDEAKRHGAAIRVRHKQSLMAKKR